MIQKLNSFLIIITFTEMYGYCVIGRELRRAKVVQYNRRYIESFLCRDFINSAYVCADKERRYKIGLLDLSGIISFYFNKEISYLVVFCKYISKKGNEFYCFIPTYIYLNYLCDLAVLQSSDLAFAADAKFIDKYCKLSKRSTRSVQFLNHLVHFFNQNNDTWCRVRNKMLCKFLKNLLADCGTIVLGFLDWSNGSYANEYYNIKAYAITFNDREYKQA